MSPRAFPTLVRKAGTAREPYRNRRGTIHGLPVPARGFPLKGGTLPAEPPELPHGMTATELLDCLGPSWGAMTESERNAYPRRLS